MRRTGFVCLAVSATILAFPAFAAMSVSLSPSLGEPQPVGASITWQASTTGAGAGPLLYRFTVAEGGGAAAIIKDFSPDTSFVWTPSKHEGSYTIGVTVRDNTTMATTHVELPYTITSRVTGNRPVVSPTGNALVALYSAPACPAGAFFRVRYSVAGPQDYKATPLIPCTGATSMNVYIGGLYARTTYKMVSDVLLGPMVTSSGPAEFRTGAIPITLPTMTVMVPPQQSSSYSQSELLYSPLNSSGVPFATDLAGNINWYYAPFLSYLTRPNYGGTMMGTILSTALAGNKLLEFDLAGNTLRETNAARINEELAAMGMAGTVNGFHHDAVKLANGNYLVIAATERILTDVQGAGDVDVLGDMILVFNPNFQVIWAWDSFEHLDTHRAAVLGETCPAGLGNGCPAIFKASVANDWLHGNSVALAPDGNLIYSARHQDFVYKIDYRNGAGDGHVIWRLGAGGDFTANSNDPWPWQSHQHDVEFEGNTNTITLFDNGNTRHAAIGGNSRGQVLSIDETNRTVTYVMNQDLGQYSFALGSAQKLTNGNYRFELGWGAPPLSIELTPAGATAFKASTSSLVYRSFRMKTLYEF